MDPVSKAQLEVVPDSKQRGRDTRFKPGQSGNPGGRKKTDHITKIYREILSSSKCREAIKIAIFNTLTTKGMAGVLLLREAAERTEGKVTQEIDLNTTLQVLSDEELLQRLEVVKSQRTGTNG